MEQEEDKELLLKDLSARLFYNVKVNFSNTECILSNIGNDGSIYLLKSDKKAVYATNIQCIKPYLRPMSSMTEEEYDEFFKCFTAAEKEYLEKCDYSDYVGASYASDMVKYDWLNRNMFDYRGLLPLGLAIPITEEKL